MTLPEFNRKAPGGESEGLPSVICGDSAILPMTAAECVREWAESLPFSPEYWAGRADGRAEILDSLPRYDRAPAETLRPRSGVAA